MTKLNPPLNETRFKNKTYAAIIGEIERLEHKGAYRGNGHHLTQRLVDMLWAAFENDLEAHDAHIHDHTQIVSLNEDHGVLDKYIGSDFMRGRTFGVHGNIRKAIVVKRDGDNVWWAWVSSVDDIGCDSIADVIAACVWVGSVDYALLEAVENNGCVPT